MNHAADIHHYSAYIYKFISQYVNISEQELAMFLPLMELRHFHKRQIILHYGETDNYLNLVIDGLVRKYALLGKEEKTLQLATEGHIVQSEISFHTRVPSTLMLEALEPTLLVSMRYDHVQAALEQIPHAEEIGRKIITYMFVKKDARYFSQLNNTVRERFLHYLNNHPYMLQRVPQKILASYLEIKPETFSRLKRLLLK